jgi:hypothetical protein
MTQLAIQQETNDPMLFLAIAIGLVKPPRL